jgi:ABC-type lipopolysaccharide export system ATPase subunit
VTAAPDSAVKRGGSVLRARNLVKRYRKRTVVNDVSLTVSAGEIVGLLGPNGAGKTTSFYMVVGLVPADSGTIELDNQDITRLPMHARARQGIGYLPQEASVFRKLSVADNILAILELRDDLDKKAGWPNSSAYSLNCISATFAKDWGCRFRAVSVGVARSRAR